MTNECPPELPSQATKGAPWQTPVIYCVPRTHRTCLVLLHVQSHLTQPERGELHPLHAIKGAVLRQIK
jgi:hypothetical protein